MDNTPSICVKLILTNKTRKEELEIEFTGSPEKSKKFIEVEVLNHFQQGFKIYSCTSTNLDEGL